MARYDKMHLFWLSLGGAQFDESRTIEPGEAPVALDTPFGRLGLSVCYDVRFPEFYRAGGTVDAWLVPSAFTAVTGAAHWDTLLRARAIENQCYVIAPAQGGLHGNGRRTHGHSMIVDPWGEVLAERGIPVVGVDCLRYFWQRKTPDQVASTVVGQAVTGKVTALPRTCTYLIWGCAVRTPNRLLQSTS